MSTAGAGEGALGGVCAGGLGWGSRGVGLGRGGGVEAEFFESRSFLFCFLRDLISESFVSMPSLRESTSTARMSFVDWRAKIFDDCDERATSKASRNAISVHALETAKKLASSASRFAPRTLSPARPESSTEILRRPREPRQPELWSRSALSPPA